MVLVGRRRDRRIVEVVDLGEAVDDEGVGRAQVASVHVLGRALTTRATVRHEGSGSGMYGGRVCWGT